jgi:protein ImuB
MLWLYLHFPHLLLDHICRSRTEAGALVVIDSLGQTVLQACPTAENHGVHAGMRLKTAINLVPDIKIARADQPQEIRVLQEQARWLYRYAAHLVLFPPDGVLAEVSSLQRLYSSLPAFFAHSAAGIKRSPANSLARVWLYAACSPPGRPYWQRPMHSR